MSRLQEFFGKMNLPLQLYQQGKYADALAVTEKIAVEFPEQDFRTVYWKICLQNMTGQPEQALQTFTDALARGAWWAEYILRSDSDLASLQGNEEFERLVKLSEETRAQAEANAKPELHVYQPEGQGPFPLLIVLGPRGSIPELNVRDWSPALKLDWMLALPISTQMASPVSYIWDDREKALNEIEAHYETLTKDYPVDADRIVIAGFSQGAARAIELVMSQRLKARGFIAVVPGKLDMAELEGWLASGVGRGVLISGGKDSDYERFIQIKEMFESHNIPLMFENYPEMGHQVPNDLNRVLVKFLNFLCETEKENK